MSIVMLAVVLLLARGCLASLHKVELAANYSSEVLCRSDVSPYWTVVTGAARPGRGGGHRQGLPQPPQHTGGHHTSNVCPPGCSPGGRDPPADQPGDNAAVLLDGLPGPAQTPLS